MLRKIEMDVKFLKASKLFRTANYQEASALYQDLITEIRKQDKIDLATQKRLAHYMLQNIECLKQSRHIPFSEFQAILTSTQGYLKQQLSQDETREFGQIDSIVQEYSVPENQQKYIQLSTHIQAEESVPTSSSEASSQIGVISHAPPNEAKIQHTSVLEIPLVPNATSDALPPLLNSKGFPMMSGLRLPSKMVKASDSEGKEANNSQNKSSNHYDSIKTVIQNNYNKDKTTTYYSMPEHVLPIPASSIDKNETQESHTLIPVTGYTRQKSRLFIEDFEEKRTPSEDGIDEELRITRLQTMLDLTDHLLHHLKSGTISQEDMGQRTILLPFARELQNMRTRKALKDSVLDISRSIYHSDANNTNDLIEHLEKLKSALETIKNGPAPKPVSTPSRSSTRKRKEPTTDKAKSSSSPEQDNESDSDIELPQDDSEELEDKVPFTPSYRGLRNSGLFSANGKKAKTLIDHREAALKAIRLGEADKLAELIGTDGYYASKLIPGDSGNTYLMYAMQFNTNVENIVATLLPASVLHVKSFGQLFCPSNVNTKNEHSTQIAMKHGNLDALKNGIAISAALAHKNTDGLFRLVDEQVQSATKPKSGMNPF